AHCALKTLFPVYTIACPKPVVKCTLSYLCPPQTKRSVEYAPDTMLRHVKRLSAQPQTPTNLAPWPALAIAQPHKLPVSWRETPEHLPDDCGIRKHLTMLGDPPLLGGFMRPSGRCPALVCSAYCRRWVLQAREKVVVEPCFDHPDRLIVRHGSHPPGKKSDTTRRTLIRGTSEGRPGGGGLFTSTHFLVDVQELAQGFQSFSPESGHLETGDISPRPLSFQRAQGQYCSCHEGVQIRQTRFPCS